MSSFPMLLLYLFPCLMSCHQVHEHASTNVSSQSTLSQRSVKGDSGTANVIFQSTDSGRSWQNISIGLDEKLVPSAFSIDKDEIILASPNGVYRSSSDTKSIKWEKEVSLEAPINNFSVGSSGMIAYTSTGHFYKKLNSSSLWLPVYTNFEGQWVRTLFTAKNGSVFIGCDNGIFKSSNDGKTWKHVMKDGWVIQMVESNGVLLCTNVGGILRSTDGGEIWENVISEGGVGIAVEVINGGFGVINYNMESKIRRIRISTDSGKNWQAIDAGLPPSLMISTIKQVGPYFFCGHPKGIYRTGDFGKTWTLLLPSIGNKVFNLFVSGEVCYAVLMEGGC